MPSSLQYFSTDVVVARRSSLSPENVNKLVCLSDWWKKGEIELGLIDTKLLTVNSSSQPLM